MASNRHLIVLAALVFVSAFAGCASKPKTPAQSAMETQSDDQRKANRIARDYLNNHGGVASNDVFVATPYEGGWMVRCERVAGTGPYGEYMDPGATRFVKIGPDWHVIEDINGAGID